MGYAHYWTPKPISAESWAIVRRDFARLFKVAKTEKIALAGSFGAAGTIPKSSIDLIAFNGLGELQHETAYFPRATTEWQFCKTNHKPYDAAVTAALIYLAAFHGYHVSSDGDASDWQAGLDLARKAWPAIDGHLAIPTTLGD